MDHLAAVVVAQARRDRCCVTAELAIGFAQHACVAGAGEGERLSFGCFLGELEQLAEVVVAGLDVLDEYRQQRLTSVGAVGTAFVDPPAASAEPVQDGGRDRARSDPRGPTLQYVTLSPCRIGDLARATLVLNGIWK